jgi:cyclopropane fatty-acyl-phospholipid synthase-like methyltransferase
MKPANDPTVDYRKLVMRGYDQCAGRYGATRRNEVESDVALLIDMLDDGARILDLGCGAGIPIARTLAQRFEVTGVDFSREMVNLSRKNVPDATFIHADIMEVELPPALFDAVVSFYTLFHLPKEHHRALFQRIHRWLKAGGYLLVTVSDEDVEAYIGEFHGVTMYWSSCGLQEYLDVLGETGFDVIKTTSIGHGYKQGHETPEEHHPLIFAQSRTSHLARGGVLAPHGGAPYQPRDR